MRTGREEEMSRLDGFDSGAEILAVAFSVWGFQAVAEAQCGNRWELGDPWWLRESESGPSASRARMAAASRS